MVSLTMSTTTRILKTCPFTRTGKLSQLFGRILQGHEQASKIPYPAKQIFVEHHNPINKFLWGIITS
jgi:hypothetical protein